MSKTITVKQDVIGTNRNLIWDVELDKYKISKIVPENSWVISNLFSQDKNICDLAKLNNVPFSTNVPEIYANMIAELGLQNKKINFKKFMNKFDFQDWIKIIFKNAKNVLDLCDHDYHNNVFMKIKNAICGLEKAKINNNLISFYKSKEENPAQKTILESFRNDKNEFAKKSEYDPFGTITGRLTIKSGPQILILNKNYRNILVSRYGNKGKIIMFDFVSLEPRFALNIVNKEAKEDVYLDISERLFENQLPRNLTKSFVLSLLYGMSPKSLAKNIKNFQSKNFNVEDISNKIYDHFEIKNVIEHLVKELNLFGYIKTNLGRKIFADKDTSPYVLYNYFIQGGSAELSLLAFNQIIKNIKNSSLMIHPIFFVHDALVLDFHENFLHKIPELVEIGSQIKQNKNLKLFLKHEEII